MPFTKDATVFRRLVANAVSDPDLRQRIENAEISEQKVVESLERVAPDIWAAADKQIAVFHEAEKHALTADASYKDVQAHKPFYLRMVEDILPGVFTVLLLSLVSLFSATVRRFAYLIFVTKLPITAGFAGGLIVALILFRAANRRTASQYKDRLEAAKAVQQSAQADADKNRSLIAPAVTTAIVSHIREYLDSVAKPVFRPDLPDTDTSGLSEVQNEEFEIITDGRRYVRGLIRKMSGGSIGIAGPRGCGKTTLLRSFWQEAVVDPKRLSIFASAPVKYEPREFLLHLFTSLCSHVIAKETRTDVPPAWTQMDALRKLPTPRQVDTGVLGSLLLVIAVFLVFTGIVVGAIGASVQPATPGASSSPAAAAAKTAQPTQSPAPAAASPTDTSSTTAAKKTTDTSRSGHAEEAGKTAPAGENSASQFSSTGIPYLIWGGVALIVGLGARFSPGQPRPTNALDFFLAPWLESSRRKNPQTEQKTQSSADPVTTALIQRAQRTLLGLRFQQSYSSGWSGTLKLPIGLEGGANAAVSFAESQLSLPEVVNEYRDFLQEAAKRYRSILIAIDELDKLASDEDAKTFLNSIKAIFGQENVYYLISISENAISSFERRGLPIRDEFDSSFDDAVYIGYLNVNASRRLLARRIADPPPLVYRAFCHVLSGGLPRDLIRCCRKLYDYRRSQPQPVNDVATTCPELVCADVKAKLDAIRFNLQRVPDEKRTAEVLALISAPSWDAKTLSDAIAELTPVRSRLDSEASEAKKAGKEPDAGSATLSNILDEINAYLVFARAVIETFASITSAARYDQLEKAEVFEHLAIARQWMAVNRAGAIAKIEHMTLPPASPVPAPTAGPVPAPQAKAAAASTAGAPATAPASAPTTQPQLPPAASQSPQSPDTATQKVSA